jgi:hypothetical protein
MSSKSPVNGHALDYLMKDGLHLKNKMKELNKDCFLNTENLLREKLMSDVKNILIPKFSESALSLSTKYRLLYSFYHSLFNFSKDPRFLSFPHICAEAPLSQLLLETIMTFPITLRIDMINLFRSKLMIPHLENLIGSLYLQLENEESENNYECIWLISECRNASGVLTRDAMEESRC